MDRNTVHRNQIPFETDILELQRFAMQGLGLFILDIIGDEIQVGGFPCAPTAPASMSVKVGAGRIYKFAPLESTSWGEIGGVGGLAAVTDAPNYIVKQGLRTVETTFPTTAPPTGGHSQKYLIEAEFQEVDDADTTTQFYNVSSPSVPIQEDVSRRRRNVANVYIKAGTPSASPTTPTVTAGRVPLWVITVANGDTEINGGDIAAHPDAPVISVGGGGGGGSGLAAWQFPAANYAASNGDRLLCKHAAPITITLPATPAAGNEVTIKGDFLTNNVIVARNGSTIEGSATDLTMDKDNFTLFLVYDGTTWRV